MAPLPEPKETPLEMLQRGIRRLNGLRRATKSPNLNPEQQERARLGASIQDKLNRIMAVELDKMEKQGKKDKA